MTHPTWLGPIRQSAFIVDNIDAGAMEWVQTQGVGPFFTFEINYAETTYRGRTVPLRNGLALGEVALYGMQRTVLFALRQTCNECLGLRARLPIRERHGIAGVMKFLHHRGSNAAGAAGDQYPPPHGAPPITMLTFCPPNPNEFDNTARTGMCNGSPVTTLRDNAGSLSLQLRVGGIL